MIDLGRALDHPFKDSDWATKLLIGVGISLVPVLSLAVNGYSLEVLRNTERGQDVPLPKWDDLGKHFVDGIKLFVAELIYAIPILALVFVMMVMSLGYGLSAGQVSAAARNTMNSGFSIVILTMSCLAVLYGLIIAFLTPALYVQVARTGTIGSAFRFSEMLPIFQHNPGDYIVVVLVPILIGVVVGVVFGVVSVFPVVGLCLMIPMLVVLFVLRPYIAVVCGHLYGQLARS
ncbi:MAG TPA: DUF4013 domain-containing protein [Anaerolineae bacterium]|jgi:hypothetical protein